MRDENEKPAQWPSEEWSPELKQLWDLTGAWRGGPEPKVEPALARLHTRLETADRSGRRRRLVARRWWSAAAAIALVLAVLAVFRLVSAEPRGGQIVTTEAAVKTIDLPDGSQVLLNKHSTLRWESNQFNAEERLVELTGEALFIIRPDALRPFRVIAGRAEVRVTGTRFNLRAYPEEGNTEVAVLSGSVSVAAAGERIELQAAQCARLEPGAAPRREAMNADNAIAWRTGKLVFRDSPLDQVVLQLERFFGVEIAWETAPHTRASSCTVSAIWKDPQLEQVFTALEKLTGLRPQRLDGLQYRLVGECSQ